MPTNSVDFLQFKFDQLTLQDVTNLLDKVTSTNPYRYLVTPNVDQVVRLHSNPKLAKLYAEADYCLCDSRILHRLAKWSKISLPVVPGSTLTQELFYSVIRPGDRIAIVGGNKKTLADLGRKYPKLNFVHHEAPPRLVSNPQARTAAAAFVAEAKARFTFIVVGSPQQEMIAYEVQRHQDARGVALCVGASLEFLTGQQQRAPRFIQNLSLEWAYRLIREPRRLWRRYLVDGIKIFPIFLAWRKVKPITLLTVGVILLLLIAGLTWLLIDRGGLGSTASTMSGQQNADTATIDLPAPDLLKPLAPAEAAKLNSERPFVKRADEPAFPFVLTGDTAQRARAETCLAQAVYYEAASEGADGGRAVAQVVLNRMKHPGYPASVCGVVYQGSERSTGCQFSFTCDGSLRRVPAGAIWTRSQVIAKQALSGGVFYPVGHATHYHADYVVPYWADSLDKMSQIGRHIFYRLRGSMGSSRAFRQRYLGYEPETVKPKVEVVLPTDTAAEAVTTAILIDPIVSGLPQAEKLSTQSASPLIVDSFEPTLLADELIAGAQPSTIVKPRDDCEKGQSDNRKLVALKPNNVNATDTPVRC